MAELMDLPRNNLAEILSKLPTKSITACRCLCKTFLDITSSDPYFFNLLSSKPSTQNLIIQFRSISERPKKYVHWIDTHLDIDAYTKPAAVGSKVSKELRLRPILKLKKFSLVNSCNGLVYFAVKSLDRGQFSLVFNPTTNEHIRVPVVGKLYKRTLSLWLGYSPSSRKYKVLRICTSHYGTQLLAQIHDLGSNDSWRDIKSKPLDFINWDNSFAFVKGHGFWLCQDDYRFGIERVAPFIVCFDFDSETFWEMEMPSCFDEHRERHRRQMSIGVDVDSDCVCMIDNTHEDLDIWNLDVNLEEEYWNWTPKFSCLDGDKKSLFLYGAILKPLQVESNGNILMASNDRNLIYYDRTRKSFRWIKMKKYHFNVVAFVPSFVSLKDTFSGFSGSNTSSSFC